MNHLCVHQYGSYFYADFKDYPDEIDCDPIVETWCFDCANVKSGFAKRGKGRRSRHRGHQHRADKFPPQTVFLSE